MRKINIRILITKISRKANFFGFSTMVLKPLKIQEKDSKKFFLAGYPDTKSPILGPKICSKFFWLQLVSGTIIEKKIKKQR
jgi:hypothetical protein